MDKTPDTSVQSILARIERAGVRPIPKQYFSLRNVLLWILAALSVVVGGLSVASIIFRVANIPRVLPPGLTELPVPVIAKLMPVLWILLLGLFSFLAYREIRATKRGYKFELHTLLLALLLASCVFGIAFYATGVGARLDHFAGSHVPFVSRLDDTQKERWMRPERGFLIGTVTERSTDSFMLVDPEHRIWTVQIGSTTDTEEIQVAMRVGVRGAVSTSASTTFAACDIRSLEFTGEKQAPFPLVIERKKSQMRSSKCGDVRPLY